MNEAETTPDISGDAQALSPDMVRRVVGALDDGDSPSVRELCTGLHAADLADLLELLRSDDRCTLTEILGSDLDLHVLHELDPAIRDELTSILGADQLAAAVRTLDTDDALYVLETLDEAEREEILGLVAEGVRTPIERAFEYPESTAGRLMQQAFVAVPGFWSVSQTLDYLAEATDVPELFLEIFVIEPSFHPLGTVHLSQLLRAGRQKQIADIMDKDQIWIPVSMDQEEVAYQFEKYHLVAAGTVDEDGRLVGMITVDDVLNVMQEEAQEDILRLGGVQDEALSDTVFNTTRSRFSWLFLNLLTAILASAVIAVFEGTIEEMVALAVLMPIVASMGGNAATQTMTVAVRSLATKGLVPFNARRVVTRETLVGLFNGILFAALMGVVGGLWFQNALLGGVLALAMIFTLFVAGIAGIMVPLLLDRAGIDPATSSAVFVTAVTDVVGFFAFLGLAAWVLL